MKKDIYRIFATLGIGIVTLFVIWQVWRMYFLAPWTRDGRLRAEIAEISAQIPGNITALYVKDNQFVKKDDPLLEIDPSDYTIAVKNAEANLASAKAKLEQYREEAVRRDKMPEKLVSTEEKRNADLVYQAQVSAVKAAEAVLEKAKLNLTRTRILAPSDGFVTNMNLRIGTYLNVGDSTLAFIDKQSFYVVGYFQETQVSSLAPDTPVTVRFLGEDIDYDGKIESIGRGIADMNQNNSSQLLPDVEQTFPWVRLAQRIPVRVRFNQLPEQNALIAGRTCTIIAHAKIADSAKAFGTLTYLK